MKLGIVDLDTSHPQAFLPIERELGHEIAGVWDGATVHPREYAAEFARHNGIAKVFESLDQMAAEVDCAVIHSCDWDVHVERARPFIDAGKAVFIDKPIAGNLNDLRQFQEWAQRGARITGGSSLLYSDELACYGTRPVSERGALHTVFTGCGVDLFNYAIHAYSIAFAALGPAVRSVKHLGAGPQRRVQINWEGGAMALLSIGQVNNWLPFHATLVSDREVTQFVVDANRVYAAQLRAVLPYLAGEVESPPFSMHDLIVPERCALAAQVSWTQGDREVQLEELSGQTGRYDGAAFAREYRAAKYPNRGR